MMNTSTVSSSQKLQQREHGRYFQTAQTAAIGFYGAPLREGYSLKTLHRYTDLEGRTLYWRVRFEHPTKGKELRFLQPAGEPDHYLASKPKFEKGQAPLYNLHQLQRQPEALVFLVEGEKCADALSAVGVVASTCGGAQDDGNADLSPLAGRHVLLWPDNDAVGFEHMERLSKRLLGVAAKVEQVEVAALGLAEKGDCADWLTLNPEAKAEDVLALVRKGFNQPAEAEAEAVAEAAGAPSHASTGFFLTEEGVFYTGFDRHGKKQAPRRVCAPLQVLGKVRDHDGESWHLWLEWRDADQRPHRWAMPSQLLYGDGVVLRQELARQGLHMEVGRYAGMDLIRYLNGWSGAERVLCVDKLGWCGGVYVLPDRALAEDESEEVVFQSASFIKPAFSSRGTVEQWRDQVAALAAGNSRLVFALSVAFAGPLLEVVGESSGGFHMRGGSSSGKTTALKLAASLWGEPSSYVRNWRATANGLEGLAAMHNDGLLILDELNQADPKQAGEAAYMLGNGQGKARANRSGAAREAMRWRLLFLSAGEESLATLLNKAGLKSNAGQEVRLADVASEAGAGLGLFECLHGRTSASALAEEVKTKAGSYYGAAGLAWLGFVVAHRQRLPDLMRDTVAEFVPESSGGQVERVARRFALVAVAGELASHFDLTGWEKGEAVKAAKACFAAWLEGFGGIGNREERSLLAQVKSFFEAHGASRFEDLSAVEPQRVLNRVGYFQLNSEGAREYLVFPEAFKTDVCKGFDPKLAVRVLLEKGWLKAGSEKGRDTQRLRINGEQVRVYVFNGNKGGEE